MAEMKWVIRFILLSVTDCLKGLDLAFTAKIAPAIYHTAETHSSGKQNIFSHWA